MVSFICGIFKKWYKRAYLQKRNRLTGKEKYLAVLKVERWGEGQIRSLGLTYSYYYI